MDPSFGTGGKVTTNFVSALDSYASAIATQRDGKILVTGSSSGYTENFSLARYNREGTLDRSFGNGGKVITRAVRTTVASGNNKAAGEVMALRECLTGPAWPWRSLCALGRRPALGLQATWTLIPLSAWPLLNDPLIPMRVIDERMFPIRRR